VWDAGRFASRLETLGGVSVRRELSLSSVTSLRVGGPADVFVVADEVRSLASVLELIREAGAKSFVIGAGTNVIFGDAGFRGVVLKLGSGFAVLSEDATEEGQVSAGASARWSDFIAFCVDHSLSGLQKLAGIPGTVGGALAGNAGAFGVAIGDRVTEVRGFDSEGRQRTALSHDVRFDYRRADFGFGLILSGTTIGLDRGEREKLKAEVEEVLARRKDKQPLEFPSAGSVFKNPQGAKAGRLIEEAGLKGRSIGGAQVSEKHANFIVNRGGARAGDVTSLIEVVREEVWKRFTVRLELEVKVVG
jgi:UDP-N-acetylmuramate dehydrogenase